MIKKQFVLFIIIFQVFSFQLFSKKISLKDKYIRWLNVVSYIISPIEKDVFLQLKTDIERDTFIRLFWKQRDPIPATPENEFKEELIKRFNYANKYFRYGSTKPGWKTDRGRIYIILGPPMERNEINDKGVYPMEIWEYFGKKLKGLPSSFRVVFYKKGGVGDFKLYNPSGDGPESLLVRWAGDIDIGNYYQMYKKLYDINPVIAEASLTLIPGEKSYDYKPSLDSSILIEKILNYQKKLVRTSYARNFLKYKGIVNVRADMNYIEVYYQAELLRNNELKINFLNIAIQPKIISVDYSDVKKMYFVNYKLTVCLKKPEEEKIILQYTKNYPYYFSKNELQTKIQQGIVILDKFPIPRGKFEVSVLLQNTVNGEFGYFSKIVSMEKNSLNNGIVGPFYPLKILKDDRTKYYPFAINGYRLFISPKNNFGFEDRVKLFFCINKIRDIDSVRLKLKTTKTYGNKKIAEYRINYFHDSLKTKCILKEIGNLSPGKYEAILEVHKGGELFLSKTSFMISLYPKGSKPVFLSSSVHYEKRYIYYYYLAKELSNMGDYENSYKYYEKAMAMGASQSNFIIDYSHLLLKYGKYEKLIKIVNYLKNDKKNQFNYYALLGKAYFFLKNYKKSVNILEKAVNLFDSDYSVWNCLGLSYLKIGKIDKSKEALKASLILNPKQKDIKKILEKIH